jgi:transposase
LTTAEREELRRLRRQNREQAETIALLRKAAVLFVKESDR